MRERATWRAWCRTVEAFEADVCRDAGVASARSGRVRLSASRTARASKRGHRARPVTTAQLCRLARTSRALLLPPCSTPPSRRCPRCSRRRFRAVLMKSIGLALVADRRDRHRAQPAAGLARRSAAPPGPSGLRRRAARRLAALAWVLSIMASARHHHRRAVPDAGGDRLRRQLLRRRDRRGGRARALSGRAAGPALPLLRALIEGIKIALLALVVYLCALPFLLFAGIGFVILFLANAYLLGREYFELAAMRFRPPHEAKALRRANRRLRLPRRPVHRGVRVDPDRQPRDAAVRHGLHGAPAQAAGGGGELAERDATLASPRCAP